MSIPSSIRDVFGHFQNLNLLVLLHDLRCQEAARNAWSTGTLLCPLAHGLPDGHDVRELKVLGQAADLEDSCAYAALRLGARPQPVLRFVRSWDDETLGHERLLRALEELWEERLADAEAMQQVLRSEVEVP
jgi:hypothetical protein